MGILELRLGSTMISVPLRCCFFKSVTLGLTRNSWATYSVGREDPNSPKQDWFWRSPVQILRVTHSLQSWCPVEIITLATLAEFEWISVLQGRQCPKPFFHEDEKMTKIIKGEYEIATIFFFFSLLPNKRWKWNFISLIFGGCQEEVKVKLNIEIHLLKIWARFSFSLLNLNALSSSKSYLNGVHWTPLRWKIP